MSIGRDMLVVDVGRQAESSASRTDKEVIVGLADLVKHVRQYGLTAHFDQRAPALLEEARIALGGK